jgi:hypothetical protein
LAHSSLNVSQSQLTLEQDDDGGEFAGTSLKTFKQADGASTEYTAFVVRLRDFTINTSLGVNTYASPGI